MILTDALADTLHRKACALLALTAQGVSATFGAAHTSEIGTGVALYAGDGSPLTQVTGFAHREPGDVDEIETFFAPLTLDWEVTVTPFTDPGTFRRLLDRGYRPAQFEGTLAQRIEEVPRAPEFEIVEVPGDDAAWGEVTWRSWTQNEVDPYAPDGLVRAVAAIPSSRRYLAIVEGVPAASASMTEIEGMAILGGAATRLPFRGRGLQTALLQRRLRDAGRGTLAVIGAMPRTPSYRNAQRVGFVPLYSTLTLMRR